MLRDRFKITGNIMEYTRKVPGDINLFLFLVLVLVVIHKSNINLTYLEMYQ
jgi:hypothetical protein